MLDCRIVSEQYEGLHGICGWPVRHGFAVASGLAVDVRWSTRTASRLIGLRPRPWIDTLYGRIVGARARNAQWRSGAMAPSDRE